jgi:hypothetical protein
VQSPATPNPPPPVTTEREDFNAPPSRSFVLLSLAISAILLISMLSVLTYRWRTQRPPHGVLVVQGDEQWDGTRLSIIGGTPEVHYSATLSEADNFTATFFLQPGQYIVHISSEFKELMRLPLTVPDRTTGVGIDLRKANVPPPHPTTKPHG